MLPLALKFLTDDAHLTELARLYCELDQEENIFPLQMKVFASMFSVPANQVLKTVLESWEASSVLIACETCWLPQQYRSANGGMPAEPHHKDEG